MLNICRVVSENINKDYKFSFVFKNDGSILMSLSYKYLTAKQEISFQELRSVKDANEFIIYNILLLQDKMDSAVDQYLF